MVVYLACLYEICIEEQCLHVTAAKFTLLNISTAMVYADTVNRIINNVTLVNIEEHIQINT